MAKYKLMGQDESNGVLNTETGSFIPNSVDNSYWVEYLNWKQGKDIEGNDLPGSPGQQSPDPQYTLAEEKEIKKNLMKQQCNIAIKSGFISSATGTAYTYQSEEKDQINLIGAKMLGTDVMFTVIDSNGNKIRVNHTNNQLNTVMNDGVAHKQQQINKLYNLYNDIDNATDSQSLDAIVW